MKRTNQHTAWAATFSTAAELSRRGYDVTFTMGNTPRIDLQCSVPDADGKSFKVQVKGISGKYAFWVQKHFFAGPTRNDLYLVVVLVPRDDELPLEFFILTHKEAQKAFEFTPKIKKNGRPYESGFGLNWGSITQYKNEWASFPQYSV